MRITVSSSSSAGAWIVLVLLSLPVAVCMVVGAFGLALTVMMGIDIWTAPEVEAVVQDVAWKRSIQYEIEEARYVRVHCNDRNRPVGARIPSHRHRRRSHKPQTCHGTVLRWWPEEVQLGGVGRDRAWPPFEEVTDCEHGGCTRYVGRTEELSVVLPSVLWSVHCEVSAADWKRMPPGDKVKVRRSRVLGLTQCDTLDVGGR